MFGSLINGLQNFVINAVNVFLALLPDCPFEAYIEQTKQIDALKYINWFVPVSDFITIGEAWLVAIAVFYLYQIVLRWIKVIGS